MNHSDFVLGETFWCADRQWRCSDIGTRVIVAIRIDGVQVESNVPDRNRTLSCSEAEAEGWFNGPSYTVAETVFDEDDMAGCTLEAEAEAGAGDNVPSANPAKPHRSAVDILGVSKDALREAAAEHIRFSPRDQAAILALLESPPTSNARLRAAALSIKA